MVETIDNKDNKPDIADKVQQDLEIGSNTQFEQSEEEMKQNEFLTIKNFLLEPNQSNNSELTKTTLKQMIDSIGGHDVFKEMCKQAQYLTPTGEILIKQKNALEKGMNDKNALLNNIDEDTLLIKIRDIINKAKINKDKTKTKEYEEIEKNTIEENKQIIFTIIQSIKAKINDYKRIQTTIGEQVTNIKTSRKERENIPNNLDQEYDKLNKAYEDYKESKDATEIMIGIEKIKSIVTGMKYLLKEESNLEGTENKSILQGFSDKAEKDKESAIMQIEGRLNSMNA